MIKLRKCEKFCFEIRLKELLFEFRANEDFSNRKVIIISFPDLRSQICNGLLSRGSVFLPLPLSRTVAFNCCVYVMISFQGAP